jgi:hypothetical protein
MFRILLIGLSLNAFIPAAEVAENPLSTFDPTWKNTRFSVCNTASKTKYLSDREKEVIYILNLVRQNPQHFNKTIVAKWPEKYGGSYLRTNPYYLSLVKHLSAMKPAPILQPDSLAWVSALCHAFTSGKNGYIGHTRQTDLCVKREHFGGECCHYGSGTALQIVMDLLIDEDIESLGHRLIMLSSAYNGIGVSYQPHSTYGYNTVLDFTR